MRRLDLQMGCIATLVALSGCKSNYERGVEALNSGDYAKAVTDLSVAIDKGDRVAEALHRRGLAKLKQDNIEGALADYELAVQKSESERDPDFGPAYYQRAVARVHANDQFSDADYRAAIELQPSNAQKSDYPEALYGRALSRLAADQNSKEALADYHRATQLRPALPETQRKIATAVDSLVKNATEQERSGSFGPAIADLSLANELLPSPDLKKAIERLEQAEARRLASLNVTARSLAAAFRNNEAAAEAKFKDQWVTVRGGVVRAIEGSLIGISVSLGTGEADPLRGVFCKSFDKSDVRMISEGDTITIRGRVHGHIKGIISYERDVTLFDCKLVK